MIDKCPGQDSRNIQAETIKCPECGYVLEIFSDEVRARCPDCKRLVKRERLPSCADWCKSAGLCFGRGKIGEKSQS